MIFRPFILHALIRRWSHERSERNARNALTHLLVLNNLGMNPSYVAEWAFRDSALRTN